MDTTIRPIHDVIAIDGEGITVDGKHLYTLLLAYDSRYDKSRYIENWADGLSTDRILWFLLHLPHGRNSVCATYFFNYDVTMWLRDLSDEEKQILWRSGWIVWHGPTSGKMYYLRYIPSKIFFIGEYSTQLGIRPSLYDWRKSGLSSITIYDTSGFAQRAFVRALDEWGIDSGLIGGMKEKRSEFTVAQRHEILNYCEDECVALAAWVQKQDTIFLEEGFNLLSWHGAGALADSMLRAHHVQEYLHGPMPPDVDLAAHHAYFGGRSETFAMGEMSGPIYDYDLNSAYPSMARYLPDLAHGEWRYTNGYESQCVYALWHVTWNLPPMSVYPFPYRYKHGIYYPSAGEGWYHATEVAAALRYYGADKIKVLEGWMYAPETTYKPMAFITEYARRRVEYKNADDPRAIPYKYGLNSIYGKLAQHAVEEGREPRYQSYYAAGFITACTRALLLHFIWSRGRVDDVLMLATDGVFCGIPRVDFLGDGLGEFKLVGTLPEMILLQPGCWYAPNDSRTRGFHKESVTYETACTVWRADGIHAVLPYTETRFIGLGTCAGTGNYADYGQWKTEERKIVFLPDHKLPSADLLQGKPHGRLTAMDMSGYGMSEAYIPPKLQDQSYAVESLAWLIDQWQQQDQPDFEE